MTPDPEIFGNNNGDNLTECEDDEYDENSCFNWINHPVRCFFDNPKNIFHPSFLTEENHEHDEEP
jgi:hypothetical protein